MTEQRILLVLGCLCMTRHGGPVRSLALLVFTLTAACASVPHGSFARPVQRMAEGQRAFSVGSLVPLWVGGAPKYAADEIRWLADDRSDAIAFVPSAAYDVAVSDEVTAGGELTVLGRTDDSRPFGVFGDLRAEYAPGDALRWVALTADFGVGYCCRGVAGIRLAPTVGGRLHVPILTGGIVLSQQAGLSNFTLIAPGSVALDVAIPVGEGSRVHVFPELRWDPSWYEEPSFEGNSSGALRSTVVVSAGLTIMLELSRPARAARIDGLDWSDDRGWDAPR